MRVAERRIEPGARTVILSIYAAPVGGEPIASETRSVQVGQPGTFTVALGELAVAASGAETRWLAVRVPPGRESRRVPLAAAPATHAVPVQLLQTAAIIGDGIIESTVHGFRFPDGSVQTSAATVSGGVPSVNGISGAVTIAGAGTASVQTVGSTITVSAPAFGTPVTVGAANAAGAANTISRSDHVHAHGDQAGGSLHAEATSGSAGFLSATDKEKLDETVAYVRTIVVSPVVGNSVASGTALLDALNGISGNSATDPYLVRIEPGIYDIGASALTMKTFVDVEGSGETATFIVASRGGGSLASSAAAIIAAASTELRDLTITNTSSSSIGIGVFSGAASSNVRRVTINSTGASQNSVGILPSSGATMTISDVTITATSTGGTSGSAGIQLAGTGKATVLNSRITGKGVGGTGTNIGINLTGNSTSATVDGCTILATGTAGQNTGVSVAPGTATIMSSTVQADTAGSRLAVSTSAQSTAILNVFHSRLLALAPSFNSSQGSVSKGSTSTLRVATSQIDSASFGAPKCVHVYDADMDDLNNVCPAPPL
ncbi:MAG TPA: hypothetical protein VFV49_08580 [Thermoanaerobaculia bacterium]|nr:hypothetical protein [Thermoanaerobaculia bacterium]